jgi:hypothetical protein
MRLPEIPRLIFDTPWPAPVGRISGIAYLRTIYAVMTALVE